MKKRYIGKCVYTKKLVRELAVNTMEKSYIIKKTAIIVSLLTVGIIGAFSKNFIISTASSALIGFGLLMTFLYVSSFFKLCNNLYMHNTLGGNPMTSEKTVSFTENNIQTSIANSSVSDSYNYSSIIGVSETKNLFIISLKEKSTIIIEKNSFSENDFSQFKIFLSNKVEETRNQIA